MNSGNPSESGCGKCAIAWLPANTSLEQAPDSGGESSPVPTPFDQNIELGDIASNRSDLLLQTFVAGESEMPLWILPALGGVPRRVGDVLGRDAAWSPNGQTIAYAKRHELYVCEADGMETRKLVAAPDRVRWPVGHPVAASCGSPWAILVEELQLRRFQPTEVATTLCSPVGRVPTAAAIGLRMGNTTFFSPPLTGGLTSGRFERERVSLGRRTASRCS